MIAAVVLAAGASRRLGRPKQLVNVGGEPLVRRTARLALAACERVVVVQGAVALAEALIGLPVVLVENPGWDEGMASSIRCGVRSVLDTDAALLLTCDQLDLDLSHLAALVATRTLAASRYQGVLGIPALFPQSHFAALLELTGDRGAQRLLGQAVGIDWPEGANDLDRPDQLRS